jgi:hypothetical protein
VGSKFVIPLILLTSCSRLRQDTPLNIPIRFEDGFSVTHEFTTHRAKQCELVVAFHKDTPIKPTGLHAFPWAD